MEIELVTLLTLPAIVDSVHTKVHYIHIHYDSVYTKVHYIPINYDTTSQISLATKHPAPRARMNCTLTGLYHSRIDLRLRRKAASCVFFKDPTFSTWNYPLTAPQYAD
jgi:hypothetical protein